MILCVIANNNNNTSVLLLRVRFRMQFLLLVGFSFCILDFLFTNLTSQVQFIREVPLRLSCCVSWPWGWKKKDFHLRLGFKLKILHGKPLRFGTQHGSEAAIRWQSGGCGDPGSLEPRLALGDQKSGKLD